MDKVDKTLKLWRQSRFEWGKTDCIISLADYLVSLGYGDYAAMYRGRYNNGKTANEILNLKGGHIAIFEGLGFEQIEKPLRGDIMVVMLGLVYVSGICTGAGIAFRDEVGVREWTLSENLTIWAWRVEKCHK